MKHFYALAFTSFLLLFVSSCNTSSNLTYFKDIDQLAAISPESFQIKIEPTDELLISVTSDSPEATALFNLPLSNVSKSEELMKPGTSVRFQTYTVDADGDIYFPTLGKLHVKGLTIEQLRNLLVEKIDNYVSNPLVKVELVNFKVNVAGEVLKPGVVQSTTQRMSVLDAITAAGDLTTYGERKNVLVIREEDGKIIHGRLDLTSAEMLNSPFFYLKQNDYVYIEPNKIQKDNSKYNQNNAFKLSVISTIVSASSVVASLIIALAIK